MLGWLAALLQPEDSRRYWCLLSLTGGKLLLTGKGADAQTGHKNFVIRGQQSTGYCFNVTGGISAYPYDTP